MCLPLFSFSSSVAIVLVRRLSTYRDQEQQQQQWQPSLLEAWSINFPLKLFLNAAKHKTGVCPAQWRTDRSVEERRTCASLCLDNVLVMPDKVINSYVLAARVASHSPCPASAPLRIDLRPSKFQTHSSPAQASLAASLSLSLILSICLNRFMVLFLCFTMRIFKNV